MSRTFSLGKKKYQKVQVCPRCMTAGGFDKYKVRVGRHRVAKARKALFSAPLIISICFIWFNLTAIPWGQKTPLR
jgi:hypothetical protein